MKVDILYIQYTNPASLPPLEHSSRILAAAGCRVAFAGINGIGLEQLVFPPHPRIQVRLLPWAKPGWRQKVHYLLFCFWVIGLAFSHRPRWIYASDLFACLPGLLLRWCGFRVLYHEHDHPGSPRSWFLRVLGAARHRLARRCPCVLPNADRAEQFRAETDAAHLAVVWNCPSLDEVGSSVARSCDAVWLVYQGSIVPQRLPIAVVQALAHVPERVRLRVIGYETVGSRGYVARLQEEAAKINVGHRVEFLGAMPRRELFSWCRKSHIGLSLMPLAGGDLNMGHMIGASNKVFDYFCQGLPVLVTDLPEWREYVSAGLGRACRPDDPESVAAALRWFADHPDQTRAMGEAARQRILQEWNYETQFRPVAELLQVSLQAGESVLSGSSAGHGDCPLGNGAAGVPPQVPPPTLAPLFAVSGRDSPPPIFSICIPQYNRTSFLLAAIKSFAEQRFQPFEVCISDGCSTDGREQELIEALRASGLSFVYQRSPVNLRYDANTRAAIGLARGRYCILMGNDDALNGADALATLWADMEKHAPVSVVISDSCDYRSGQRAFRIRESVLCGAGPRVAAFHFRNFSFVSGIVLNRESAQALATEKWDGSEMYQTFVGCRMIASGGPLLERAASLVRKDIVVPGESVDSYAKHLKGGSHPLIERCLPLGQLGRLVADAIAPYTASKEKRRLNEAILLQLLGITYPYWLFEYRHVASWRYAAGIALGMRPRRTAAGVELGFLRRLRLSAVYAAATALGLSIPRVAFAALKSILYKFAKSIR